MRRRWLWIILAVLLLVPLLLGANTLRNWAGIAATTEDVAQRRALLQPYWRMVPDGPVSDTGSVLLSGCDGVHDNMDYWAGVLAQRGFDGLILDSHTPRKLNELESWRLLCMGQVLPGAERAGDIAVALSASQRDRVILLGASHGGWSVLEFLGQGVTGRMSPGLSAWSEPPAEMLDRVAAAVVLYPYCGMLNKAAEGDWSQAPPVLMIVAGQDELGLAPDCIAMADDLRDRGAQIELLIYDDAGHGFEQQERAAFSTLEYDAGLREQATRDVLSFLDRNDL